MAASIVAIALAALAVGGLLGPDTADDPARGGGEAETSTTTSTAGTGKQTRSTAQRGNRDDTRGQRPRRVGSGRGGVRLARVGTFDSPTYVTGAPGFPRLLFIVEQPGRIMVARGNRVSPRPFLDISGRVRSGGEQGLLSVAFPPDYRRTGRFYIYFTGETGDIRIEERRRARPLRAHPTARRTVLRIRHREHTNHNGGQLQFLGRHLYIGTGDGGGAGDPDGNAQNRGSLLGKLLRIDPRRAGNRPYRVPEGNPYVGRKGRNEIFSIGLRNPWRFSFDRRGKRPKIAIADVGQSAQEEVNYLRVGAARGANFGWNLREGLLPYESERTRGLTDPVFVYGREHGCSITGGYVVRDRRLPTLFGRYVFSDLCDGEIRSFVPRLGRVGSAPGVGLSVDSPTSFGEDQMRRIYVASHSGPVYRLVPAR